MHAQRLLKFVSQTSCTTFDSNQRVLFLAPSFRNTTLVCHIVTALQYSLTASSVTWFLQKTFKHHFFPAAFTMVLTTNSYLVETGLSTRGIIVSRTISGPTLQCRESIWYSTGVIIRFIVLQNQYYLKNPNNSRGHYLPLASVVHKDVIKCIMSVDKRNTQQVKMVPLRMPN